MRQKAEKEIRSAVASLSSSHPYRIDYVRQRTALIRKVFDKTILDMERVGTISLNSLHISEVDETQIGDFIRKGDTVYISFTFLDADADSGNSPPFNPPRAEKQIPEELPVNNDDFSQDKHVEDHVEKPKSKFVNITLQGFYRSEWERFEYLCERRENKRGVEKIWEIICEYNQKDKN